MAFDLFAYLAREKARFEPFLERYFESCFLGIDETNEETKAHSELYQAMRYALFAPGKRLRPILLLHTNQLFHGDDESAAYAASALEMIHTYSLIHDDLPAMDNAETRRGQASVHTRYSEATAILAGDALLTEAFRILAQAPWALRLDAKVALKVAMIIGQAAGMFGMIRGQELDLKYEHKPISLETLQTLHACKTARMFIAAATAGATLAKADDEAIEALRRYGELIGLAFQIRDDILDVESDEATLGKPTGNDAAKEKATYPRLLGLAQTKRKMATTIEEALSICSEFKEDNGFLAALALFIGERAK